MFCPNCGTKNPDDAIFCEACGSTLTDFDGDPAGVNPVGEVTNPARDYRNEPAVYPVQTQTPPQPTYGKDYYSEISATAGAVSVKAPRKPIPKKVWIILLAAVVLAAAVIGFFSVGNAQSKPEKTAEQFMSAIRNKDWDKMYSYVTMPESQFLTKETFETYQKQKWDMVNIVNYSILPQQPQSAHTNNQEMENEDGGLAYQARVQYTTPSTTVPQTITLNLIKQTEKSMLFFDTWKISVQDDIISEYSISAPSFASVSFDGTVLNDSDLATDKTTNEEEGQSVYIIKNIFAGQHTLKTTSDYTEDNEEIVSLDQSFDSAYTVSVGEIKEDIISQLKDKSESVIKDIYNAALAHEDFDSLQDYFSTDSTLLSDFQWMYSGITDRVFTEEDGGVKKVEFSNFNVQGEQTNSQQSDLCVSTDVSFNYKYTYSSHNYADGTNSEDKVSDLKSATKRIWFGIEDGKWVITSCENMNLYFYY